MSHGARCGSGLRASEKNRETSLARGYICDKLRRSPGDVIRSRSRDGGRDGDGVDDNDVGENDGVRAELSPGYYGSLWRPGRTFA